MIFFLTDIQPSGLENAGLSCWKDCNKRQGKCDWCGTDGYCCRKYFWKNTKNGCDGSFGGNNKHTCVLKPPEGTIDFKNAGKSCWKQCNRQQGKCDWCGSDGYCCRKNFWKNTENGCDGSFGGNRKHACVLKPEEEDEEDIIS